MCLQLPGLPIPPLPCHTPVHCCRRAKQRRQRLERSEAQFVEQQQAAVGGGGAPAEPHLGDATSEESEGEVSHFSSRQAEVQEAADAGKQPAAVAGGVAKHFCYAACCALVVQPMGWTCYTIASTRSLNCSPPLNPRSF